MATSRAPAGQTRAPFGLGLCGAAAFASSAGALALEISAVRLLAPLVGTSLHIWTAVIATVVAGFTLGHWLGGRFADNGRPASGAATALALAAIACLATLALFVAFASDMRAGSGAPIVHVAVLCLALFFAPTIAAGAVSPLLAKLAVDANPAHEGRAIGTMFALGTLGAIAGALAAGFGLISALGAAGTLLAVAALFGVLATTIAWRAGHARRAMAFAALFASLAAGGGSIGFHRGPCTTESAYYCIRLIDESALTGMPTMSIYLDHDAQSSNIRDDPTFLYWSYAHFFDEILDVRLGARIGGVHAFYLGGGGYSVPRAIIARDPLARIVVAELDPEVTAIAMSRMWVSADPRMTVVHGDGRLALQALPEEPIFDVFFGDAYKGLQVPAHLVTREFNRAVRARLKPGGMHVINLIDARASPHLLHAVVATLALDHPVVEVWLESSEILSPASTTYLIVAGDTPTPTGSFQARRGAKHAWVRLAPEDLRRDIAAHESPVLTDDFAPVDRLGANFCSLRILSKLGIDLARTERCP
ncbi:MAG: fused MFS/spermidine synthase [Alphaproteobacteria bacterium]